jgi:hypothetical protein
MRRGQRPATRVPSIHPSVSDAHILRSTDRQAARCVHDLDDECGGYHWRYSGGHRNAQGLPTVDMRLGRLFGVRVAPGIPYWCDSEELGFKCVNPHHGPAIGGLPQASSHEVFGEDHERGEGLTGGFSVFGGSDLSQAEALRFLEHYRVPNPEDEAGSRWLAAHGFNDEGHPSEKVDRETARKWLRDNGFDLPEEEPTDEQERALAWLRGDAA